VESQGAFAVIDAMVPPGAGPPPHRHHREEECFFVVEGAFTFHADEGSFSADAGSWVTLPRGSRHWFRNTGDRPGRLLILVVPAGLEEFFLEIGRPVVSGDWSEGRPTPEDVRILLEAAPRYGLEILLPEHP
jgi:hypothetical protein